MNYILILGIAQSLLALMLLKISKQRRPVHYLLSWLLVCICMHLCIKLVIYTATGSVVVQRAFNTFLDLAYGPLLWMVARKVQNDRYTPVRHWYLFLPAMIAAVAYVSMAVVMVVSDREPIEAINLYNSITIYFISASMIIFPVLSYRIAQQLSSFWQTEKKFIRNLVILFFLMGMICVSSQVLSFFIPISDTLNGWIRVIGYSLMAIECVLIIRYLFKLQADLASGGTAETIEEPVVAVSNDVMQPAKVKALHPVQKSILPSDQQQRIMEDLEAIMEQRKLYTDTDLNLDKLAAVAKIPKHHISESLHQHAGTSFYLFVNQYRVREVIAALDKCRRLGISPNILSLAYEAGFNSKSTFNHYFKKISGYTPSEHLKTQHAKASMTLHEDELKVNFTAPKTVG